MKQRISTNAERGVTLIEVMVTVLLLSTSLLALASLQNRSLQYNHEAYLRSQANLLAYDIIDRMRSNLSNWDQYSLNFDSNAPTGSSQVATDLRSWRQRVTDSLPAGDSAVGCDTSRLCTISLRWAENDGADSAGEGDGTTTTFTYQTRL